MFQAEFVFLALPPTLETWSIEKTSNRSLPKIPNLATAFDFLIRFLFALTTSSQKACNFLEADPNEIGYRDSC